MTTLPSSYRLTFKLHRRTILFGVAFVVLSAGSSRGDTIGAYLRGTRWLVESSDIVLVGKKTDNKRTQVLALLKSPQESLTSHAVGKQILIRDLDNSERVVSDEYDSRYYAKNLEVGERALFFLRLSKSGAACLSKQISLDRPIKIDLKHPATGNAIEFYGVEDGRPIKSPVELLQVVVDRIRMGTNVSLSIYRENVELTDTLRPFYWRPVAAEWTHCKSPLNRNEWAFVFCSPLKERFWHEITGRK